jgi:hypothetical protein
MVETKEEGFTKVPEGRHNINGKPQANSGETGSLRKTNAIISDFLVSLDKIRQDELQDKRGYKR